MSSSGGERVAPRECRGRDRGSRWPLDASAVGLQLCTKFRHIDMARLNVMVNSQRGRYTRSLPLQQQWCAD